MFYVHMSVLLDMEAKLIVGLVTVWAVCHIIEAQIQTPTTLQVRKAKHISFKSSLILLKCQGLPKLFISSLTRLSSVVQDVEPLNSVCHLWLIAILQQTPAAFSVPFK